MRPTERLVLDTSAYSHLRAGHVQVLDHVADAAVVVMPVTVLGELEAGFELGRRTQETAVSWPNFSMNLSPAYWTSPRPRFGTMRESSPPCAGPALRSGERRMDCGGGMECNGHLLTFDRDFRHIMDLDHTLLEAE